MGRGGGEKYDRIQTDRQTDMRMPMEGNIVGMRLGLGMDTKYFSVSSSILDTERF